MKNKTNAKDIILNTTIDILLEDDNQNSEIIKPPSFREIAAKAEVSLGLINYHFSSQDNLIRQAVKWYINTKVIGSFDPFQGEEVKSLSDIDKLTRVILGPLDFIHAYPKLARISILNDFTYPSFDDNSAESWEGMYEVVKRLKKDGDDQSIRIAVWSVIASVHEAFLRPDHFRQNCGFDLRKQKQRYQFANHLAKTIL